MFSLFPMFKNLSQRYSTTYAIKSLIHNGFLGDQRIFLSVKLSCIASKIEFYCLKISNEIYM